MVEIYWRFGGYCCIHYQGDIFMYSSDSFVQNWRWGGEELVISDFDPRVTSYFESYDTVKQIFI